MTNILFALVIILGWFLIKALIKNYKLVVIFDKIKLNLDSLRNNVDLELATTQQIVEEMARRPNNKFLLLSPHQRSEDLHVEIHSANIPVPLALNMLRATYEGVMDVVRRNGGEIEDDE